MSAESRAPSSLPILTHWSYDSPWNPLFGGGGAQRDWEILRRLTPHWEVRYNVGGFGGSPDPAPDSGIHTTFLGNGKGRLSSRLQYAIQAGRAARQNPPRNGLWSISPSIFAPVPAYLAHPERTAVSLFHLVGWNAWSKYGPVGLLAIWHERQILNRMRHFLCINNRTARLVAKRRPDAHVEVVETGFTPLEELDAGIDRETILSFGRIDVYMKGIDRLLEAFAIVGSARPETRLVLAGRADAGIQSKVRELVAGHPCADRIEFIPNPDDSLKARLFRGATVFCAPSRFEGWCIAAVEAQSCGVPVVASTADGFLDSVDDGTSGLLVPNQDGRIVAGTAEALQRILGDRDLAARLGTGGRAKAAKLTWDAVAARHGEIFREIAQVRP